MPRSFTKITNTGGTSGRERKLPVIDETLADLRDEIEGMNSLIDEQLHQCVDE